MTATTQQMTALATANERRLGVAEFKRETRRLGTRGAALRVASVFEEYDGDPVMGAARTRHLLMCVPHLGYQKVAHMLGAVDVRNWDKRLRDLTPRQREGLALLLRTWVERWQGRAQ